MKSYCCHVTVEVQTLICFAVSTRELVVFYKYVLECYCFSVLYVKQHTVYTGKLFWSVVVFYATCLETRARYAGNKSFGNISVVFICALCLVTHALCCYLYFMFNKHTLFMHVKVRNIVVTHNLCQ